MIRNSLIVALGALAAVGCRGCSCGGGSLGPLTETKPADLGPQGIVIDQPKDGETISGQWVAVTGWFDRSKYDFVLITGAPRADFYAPTGHVGVGTVPVVLRDDGRFIAPRVPLAEGSTQLQIIAFTKDVAAAQVTIKVTGAGTDNVPATIVVDPPEGGPPLTVTLTAHAASAAPGWQWDFDADGTFDSQENAPQHTYGAGHHAVLARTQLDGRWLYALTEVLVSESGASGPNGVVGPEPSKVVVVPDVTVRYPADEFSGTRYVLVAEPDRVRVMDPHLHEVMSLTGLSGPKGMAVDSQGRIYVSDTGNNRLVRFTAQGALDATWADGGVFTGLAGNALSRPAGLRLREDSSIQEDGGTVFTGKWSLDVLEEGGRELGLDEDLSTWSENTSPFGIGLSSTLKPNDVVYSEEGDAYFTAGGKLYQPGISTPEEIPAVPGMRSFAAASNMTSPYWAELDPLGNLHEWFTSTWNHRFTHLAFDARALAVDAQATRFFDEQRRATDHETWTFGPVVLIIAGPNHIERYTVPAFARGITW